MLKRLTPSELTSQNDGVADAEIVPASAVGTLEPEGRSDAEIDAHSEDEEFGSDDEEGAPSLWTSWMGNDSQAFMASLVLHTILILALALVRIIQPSSDSAVALDAAPEAQKEELEVVEDFAISDEPQTEIGANSLGDTAMALATAPTLSEVSSVPVTVSSSTALDTPFNLNDQIKQPVGLVRSENVVKGMTGVGTTGTDGAVDRITYELLRSMEERPTLVVWFFDQSGSLQRRRQEIRDRFDRIYEELGIVRKSQEAEGKTNLNDESLLTAVFAFGDKVNLLTPQPTADLAEIRSAIDSIEEDTTGTERVFSAIFKAVEKFKSYRSSKSGHGAERNVIFIAVTDERGDDAAQGLDGTIDQCRKFAIPVYVIGVPAPFGREFTYVKYVDPDPKYDQTPQWAQVDQGPESLMPERVKLGYRDNYFEEPVMDSGFGPYALSRLTYETGGIYFTVHPNRKFGSRVGRGEIEAFASDLEYFFDPEIMAKYRPDYVSSAEYQKKVAASPLRQTLIRAAQVAAVETLQAPQVRFVKRDEASLANALTASQQQAARLEPQLAALAQLLLSVEQHRDKEASPRWIAGYDLAVGTVLAHKVRAEAYNAMLAKAKRGMPFENPKNNTWILKPENEITVGSKLEKEAANAKKLLEEVAAKHSGTPWGLLATRELGNPIGWKWVEEFTDLDPPRRAGPNNNNPPPVPQPAQNDKARMLAPQAPKRPIPKL
ncbi:MAG: vWA domain-containing protein [Pirellulales bacterium]